MAKSLGMIHTVNAERLLSFNSTTSTWMFTDVNGIVDPNIDLSQELTRQLQRMTRQGNYYKVVGIDISASATPREGFLMTGLLEYYAPTRGRCMAYRNAYRSVMSLMKNQGINHKVDDLYDFRVQWNGGTTQATDPQWYTLSENVATIDGTYPLVLRDGESTNDEIFTVHNSNIAPASATQTQPITFGAYGSTTDFRLNEVQPFSGNADAAHVIPESIPFSVAYDSDVEQFLVQFDWRPDPALYLSVMLGLFNLKVTSVNDVTGSEDDLSLQIAVHVSGWKSIMGNPDKKKKRLPKKRSSRGKSTKRKSKK